MSENRLAVLLPIQPLTRETTQERVYAQLRDLILDGGLPPGQTVTIQGLANSFGVSAMPVREALQRLTAERALAVLSGRSIGIPPLTQERLRDLCRVRVEVEGMAVAWAAGAMRADGLRRMDLLLRQMSAAETGAAETGAAKAGAAKAGAAGAGGAGAGVAGAGEGRSYVSANRQFHFLVYAAAGSPTLLGMIEQLWLQVSPYFHLLRDIGNWREANHAHHALRDACVRGDGEAARSALRDDIERATAALETLL